MTTEIERTNLDAHVSICELRYQQLTDRVAQVEAGVQELKQLLMNLDQRLQNLQLQQHGSWDRAQVAVIGTLLAVSGWLLARWLS